LGIKLERKRLIFFCAKLGTHFLTYPCTVAILPKKVDGASKISAQFSIGITAKYGSVFGQRQHEIVI
jgi:hypothetical protein